MNSSNNPRPPKLASRLFKWICGPGFVEDWIGDLEEIFNHNVEQKGLRSAEWLFWKQVISLSFSYALKKRIRDTRPHYSVTGPSMAMFNNYFKVATRSLVKHRMFTFINVIGLAMGMSIGLLALAMFNSLNQFDQFHVKGDRIYRVNTKMENADGKWKLATSAPYLADQLEDFPTMIESTVRVNDGFNTDVVINKNEVSISGYYVTPNFLSTFSYPLVQGDSLTVLVDPFAAVITEQAAMKIFGRTDVMGEFLEVPEKGRFKVTGVMKDYPKSSHAQFDLLVSYRTMESIDKDLNNRRADRLYYTNSYHYLLLKPGVEPDDLEEVLAKIGASMTEENTSFGFYMEPVADLVSSQAGLAIGPSFDRLGMLFFFVLTMIILIPAVFNYANLSMARALKRAKEIGLRKVVGGGKRDIFIQFIFETVILTLIALVGSVFIFNMIRDEYLGMIVNSESLDLSVDLTVVLMFIAFALFAGLLAGVIPAMFFSKLKPIDSLNGTLKSGSVGKMNLRRALTVVQFTLSFFFIFGVIAMGVQYKHTVNFEMGFNKANQLIIPLNGVDQRLLKNEFSSQSEVQSVAYASGLLGMYHFESTYVQSEVILDSIPTNQLFVDNAFIQQMGLNLMRGMKFEEQLGQTLEEQLIVNQTFVKAMKWTEEEAMNRQVVLEGGKKGRIVGLIADFNYQHLRDAIKPFFLRYNPEHHTHAFLQLQSDDLFETISTFEVIWQKLEPNREFEFTFLEEELDKIYETFRFQMKIFGFLSLIAITISCLGMLGMVVFTMENRIKEIGIRKVMGAGVRDMTLLLSSSFLKIMIIACLIAAPISYFAFDFMFSHTLEYARPIGVIELLGSMTILLVLGGLPIITQTIRTAKINPAENLRYE